MKTTVSLLLFLSLSVFSSGKEKTNLYNNHQGIIAGKIVGDFAFKKVKLSTQFINVTGSSINPNKEGFFKFIVTLPFNLEFRISFDKTYSRILVRPGDSIFVTIDESKEPNIVFSGDNQIFLNQLYQVYQEMWNLSPFIDNIMDHCREDTPSQYLDFRKKRFVKDISNIKNICETKTYLPELEKQVETNYRIKFCTDLLFYLNDAPLVQDIKLNRNTIPQEYIKTVDSLYNISKDHYEDGEFHNLLVFYLGILTLRYDVIESLIDAYQNHNVILSTKLTMDYILKNFTGIPKDYLLTHSILGLIDRGYLTDDVFDTYSGKISCEYFTDILSNKVRDYKIAQSKSIDQNRIYLYDISQSDTISIIKLLTRNHKGKIQYVDIWATWCGPCIANFAYYSALRNKLSGSSVDLIYVAISSKKDQWESLIKKNKLEGFHYLLNEKQNKELKEYISYSVIPHYFIVGPTGEILNKEAYAPYEPGLIKLLKDIKTK